jgi:hypothetical protein
MDPLKTTPRLEPISLIPGVALALLAVLAALSIFQGFCDALMGSQEFQWSPTVLLTEGKNPYSWYLTGNADGRIILSQQPNYLQLLYLVLVPFGLLGWIHAKCAWAVANLVCGAFSAHIAARRNALRPIFYWTVVLAFFLSTAFRNTVGNGQFGLVALLTFLIAWTSRATPAGGIVLALGSVKYSFAPPLWLWLLLERQRSAVVAGLGLLAAAWAVFSLVVRANPLQTLFQPIQVGAAATGEGIGDIMSLCRHFHCDEAIFVGFSYLSGGLTMAVAMAILWLRRRELDDEIIFSALCVVALGSFFHLAYDLVFLLPAFAVSFRTRGPVRHAIWIIVGYFWFALRFIDHMPMTKTALAIAIHFAGLACLFALLATTDKARMVDRGEKRSLAPAGPLGAAASPLV